MKQTKTRQLRVLLHLEWSCGRGHQRKEAIAPAFNAIASIKKFFHSLSAKTEFLRRAVVF
ncbi:hypothetical protein [Pseudomonas sp. Root329]|uniref:hypothetical protein n=1 Tax=Pseudomonas sp. Root329 TaxID=1736515 RepID=UPI000A7AF450|nr:hypothetical protein [Pseudomonas sp. Root329]